MENNNQIEKLDNTKFIEIITRIPNLSEKDKKELTKKVMSDELEIRKSAFEKLSQSRIAENDLREFMEILTATNKEGMYIKSKQNIKTGSGSFDIEIKGGDSKLIIPVLIIVGIVVIATLIIIFWK